MLSAVMRVTHVKCHTGLEVVPKFIVWQMIEG